MCVSPEDEERPKSRTRDEKKEERTWTCAPRPLDVSPIPLLVRREWRRRREDVEQGSEDRSSRLRFNAVCLCTCVCVSGSRIEEKRAKKGKERSDFYSVPPAVAAEAAALVPRHPRLQDSKNSSLSPQHLLTIIRH